MKTARDQFSRRREMSVREYDPARKASLFGTGEVVRDAGSQKGVRSVWIKGGWLTMMGGAAMASLTDPDRIWSEAAGRLRADDERAAVHH